MKPKQAFLAMVGLLVLVIAGGGYGCYYLDGLIAKKASKVSDLKAQSDALDVALENANSSQDKLEELAFINDVVKEVIPESKNQSDLIAEIITIANQSNIKLDSINFSGASTSKAGEIDFDTTQTEPTEGITGVNTLQFSITSNQTTYSDPINFLKKVENNRRKMQVNNLRIGPEVDNNGNPSGIIAIDATIDVFVRAEG